MIVCRCNEVEKKEIIDFLKKHPDLTPGELKKSTGASLRCGRCAPLVENIYTRHMAKIDKSAQLKIRF